MSVTATHFDQFCLAMLFHTSFLCLLALGLVDASPTPQVKKRNAEGARFVVKELEATREASPLVQSENVLTLKSSGKKAKGSSGKSCHWIVSPHESRAGATSHIFSLLLRLQWK